MTDTEIRESGFKVSNSFSTDQTQEGILKQLKQINGGRVGFFHHAIGDLVRQRVEVGGGKLQGRQTSLRITT
jgi:hypothetical protein